MSFQPPTAVQPVVPAPPPARSRRTGLLGLGIAVVVVGAAVGIALVATSGSKETDAIEHLARAPVGCTTTLHVDTPATFLVFVETTGHVDPIDGGCVEQRLTYRHAGRAPTVDLTLVDGAGHELQLDRRSGVSFDGAGYHGESVREVTIAESGDYQLTAQSSAGDLAVSIGKDPNGAGDSMRTAGLVVLGLRRKPPMAMAIPTGSLPPPPTIAGPVGHPAPPPLAPPAPGPRPYLPPPPAQPGQWPGPTLS